MDPWPGQSAHNSSIYVRPNSVHMPTYTYLNRSRRVYPVGGLVNVEIFFVADLGGTTNRGSAESMETLSARFLQYSSCGSYMTRLPIVDLFTKRFVQRLWSQAYIIQPK